jgi:hypothetical protein
MASPCSVSPATIIFSPLYSGGLWLPVISTPEPVPKCWVAKYSNGVGTMPISTTSMPVERSPVISASRSMGPDSRPSRPTANWRTPRSRPVEPSAAPIAVTASVVNVLSTTPRTS